MYSVGVHSAHNWYFDVGWQTSLRPFSKLASSEEWVSIPPWFKHGGIINSTSMV